MKPDFEAKMIAIFVQMVKAGIIDEFDIKKDK